MSRDAGTAEFIKQLDICDAIIRELIAYTKEHVDEFIVHCLEKGILGADKAGREAVTKDLDAAASNVTLMVSVISAQIEYESAADQAMMKLIGDVIFGPQPPAH